MDHTAALAVFVLFVAILALVGAAATNLGVDSRPGFDGRRLDT